MKPKLRDSCVASLEAENDVLRARIAVLEQEIGLHNAVPLVFGLTPSESAIVSMLLGRGFVTKEQLLIAVTRDVTGNQAPGIQIVDVYVCKIRRKLEKFGIVIETVWGRGYNLDADNRARAEFYLNAMTTAQIGDRDGTLHEHAACAGRLPSTTA